MSDSALKLSLIFAEAGAAFSKLSELTRDLHIFNESDSSCKWNEEEVEMLRECVHRFALDLHQLTLHIKNKTIDQIKGTLRKKAFEDAGIPLGAEGRPDSPDTTDSFSEPEEYTSDSEVSEEGWMGWGAGGGEPDAAA